MINIAVMGYGTVGSGVVEVIDTNGERIAQRIGDALNVKYVLDIRDFPEDPIQEKIIHDFETIISDDEIRCGSHGRNRASVYLCEKKPSCRKMCRNFQ